jgi:hypothetical protein
MNVTAKRLAAVTAAGAMSVLASGAGASAASAQVPVFPRLPAAGAFRAFPFPAVPFAPVPLGFQGPQVAIGPTVIGSVFNGGTSVVVANDPPVNSGNVIGSP